MDEKRYLEYIESYNSGDYYATAEKFYNDDVVYESGNFLVSGQKEVADFFTNDLHRIFQENLSHKNIVFGENKIAVELIGQLTGLVDDDKSYVKPIKKGEVIECRMAAFYTIKNNKISYINIYHKL